MDKSHLRFYICTRVKLGLSAKAIHQELCQAWGEGCASYSMVADWTKRFKEGRQSFDDDERIGRPVTSTTDDNIHDVYSLITENPHISLRYIAEETDLSYGTVSSIVHEQLNMRKICARWVPHHLTEQDKHHRVSICADNLQKFDSGQWRLCDVMTEDETWIYHRAIPSKQSSKAWVATGKSPPTLVRRSMSDKKNMFAVFFRSNGVTFIHMLPHGVSMNGTYYCDHCLEPALTALAQQRPKTHLHGIKLHQDNARPHLTKANIAFLEERHVTIMPQPAYSPDIAPADFWLFSYLKKKLETYDSENDVHHAVSSILQEIPPEEYHKTFQKWIERMRMCIQNGGDYFEHLM